MIKRPANWRLYFTIIVGLCLGLAFQADAQRGGGGGGFGGGGFGGGGFGGGGFGGGTTRSSTGAGTTSRTYPNNTTIGDAYFSIDPETRRVVYITDAATAQYISQVLTNLDRPKPQVLIKVLFLEVTLNNSSDIGIEGGFSRRNMNGNVTDATAAQGFGMSPLSSAVTNLNPFGQPYNSFQPVSPMTQPGAGLVSILGEDYRVTLRAIAQAGKSKILSRPSILARNNQPATITVGEQVPLITSVRYDTFGNAINSVTYTDVGVILKVTPFITADGLVEMIISPQISSIDPTFTVPISTGVSAPVIDVRSADTVAVTADKETVIIGGLIGNTKSVTDTKVPLLGDIPLLGNLFKRQQKSDVKTELIIFLTPHIVQAPAELATLSGKEKDRSGATQGLTEEELDKFLDEQSKRQASPDASPKARKAAPVLPPKGF